MGTEEKQECKNLVTKKHRRREKINAALYSDMESVFVIGYKAEEKGSCHAETWQLKIYFVQKCHLNVDNKWKHVRVLNFALIYIFIFALKLQGISSLLVLRQLNHTLALVRVLNYITLQTVQLKTSFNNFLQLILFLGVWYHCSTYRIRGLK